MGDLTQLLNPFVEEKYPDEMEKSLVEFAQQGQKDALSKLIKAHQAWIFNIALKMVYCHEEAADITQEVLIKMITKLSTFKGESKFRTWLYRIVVNHIINMKKGSIEKMISTFEAYGNSLDTVQDADLLTQNSSPVDLKLLVDEAKIGCMAGMLLCLNREQRLIYILGELLNVSDAIGSELLEITKDNFRQKLSRARKDLYNFMNEKCGLVRKSNPCRCKRKTKGFIEFGYVDPSNLKFTRNHYGSIMKLSPQISKQVENMIDYQYTKLFKEHPFQKPRKEMVALNEILNDNKFKQLLNLNN